MIDLLIENARIVDGTGAPWFRGALGIDGSRINSVYRRRDDRPKAETTVDVDEAIVCPGFIDTHSHSDLELFRDPLLEPKVRQGITTEILGQDGFSVAPVSDERRDAWKRQLRPLDGSLEQRWTWSSVTDYFERVRERGLGPNVATLVGHGTVRHEVMGMDDRSPKAAELEEMTDLVDGALDQGAIGFSTGLVYTPQTHADTAEVERLASVLSSYGRPFVAHIRSERSRIWSAMDEFVDIGFRQGIPLHLSHFKMGGPPQHGKASRGVEFLEIARERGVDITAEVYPYTASSTTLTYVLPPWVYADGSKTALEYLADDAKRARIRSDIEKYRIDDWENPGAYSGWENIVITRAESSDEVVGNSIEELAEDRDADPVSIVCDLLLENDLDVSIVNHFLDEGDVRTILASGRVCLGSDGIFGGRPHPRVYGTFPRVLGHYCRDENLLGMEEVVRKMTSLPARIMGLSQKGILRPGMDADVAVFDPEVVGSTATFENPHEYPDGIPHVIVNGEFVVRDHELTGQKPGQPIRAGHEG